jgi:hypothetical protein
VLGSTIAAAGSHAVKWHGLVSKVIIPGLKTKVTPDNVNDEWTGQVGLPAVEPVAA